jgi:hypothetical protein
MCGVEMLDQDEGHPAVRGKKVEELAEGFQAARGSTQPDNRKVTER